MLAVAEKTKEESFPSQKLYQIRPQLKNLENDKKIIRFTDTKSNCFQALAFSTDGKFLAALTNEPDYQLIFVDIFKQKIIATAIYGINATTLNFSQVDNHIVSISAINSFKILRVQDSSFIVMIDSFKKLNMQQNFTDHLWLPDNRIVLANDKGEINIIKEQEMVQQISNVFGEI